MALRAFRDATCDVSGADLATGPQCSRHHCGSVAGVSLDEYAETADERSLSDALVTLHEALERTPR